MMISAMSVISPYGIGTQAFVDGVRAGRVQLSVVDDQAGTPQPLAGVVPPFDVAELLGEKRPLRNLGRPGGLAVGAVALLLREHDLADLEPGERGLVLGGDLMTTDRAMDIMRDSLTEAMPYHVNAKQFPGSVMNHPAAQCAMKFDLKGPNATVTAGRVTGLSVLNYARRLHRAGRAPVVLAGAVEDVNPRRSWITWHGHGEGSTAPLGEGCCLFLTESRESALRNGRKPVAELLAMDFGAATLPESVTETLAARIRRALTRSGVVPGDVSAAFLSGVDGDAEHAAVASVLGRYAPMSFPASLIGDMDGAMAAFQLAAAIAEPAGSLATDRVALITAVDPDGQVGCGVFRILSP
jgi:3-oxoacyl-[acyl-carrier-protein] synthase II